MNSAVMEKNEVNLRNEPQPSDREALRALLASTGFFYEHEILVALELLDDRLAKGTRSEYHFILADVAGRLAGYVCYGPISMATGRFDMYWIGVHRDAHRRGLGTQLLLASEARMRAMGGKHIYVETSSRELYEPTRRFYEKHAYRQVARIPFYYADDDDRVVYLKSFEN
jgi:ribosomal protein S18 acetylase RimI-like enzyme